MNETGSDQDKPLTSAEMIRQAREVFAQPMSAPDIGAIDKKAIEKQIEAEMPKITATYTAPRTATATATATAPRLGRRNRRVARRSDTPLGFGEPAVRRSNGAVLIAIATALVVLGIAVLLAVASSSSGL